MATSALTALKQEENQELDSAAKLRVCDKVVLGFLAYSTILGLELHLSLAERAIVVALNVLASAVLVSLSRIAAERPSRFLLSVRGWFPAALILLAYRESGLFFSPDPTHRLDLLFVQWDTVLLRNHWIEASFTRLAPWLQYYLEMAYLLCYPLVPLGLGCLLLAKHHSGAQAKADSSLPSAPLRMTATPKCHPERSEKPALSAAKGSAFESEIRNLKSRIVDHFWTAVLVAALFCYAVYPFFPLTPPRLLFHDLPGPAVSPLLRVANFWLLGTYGVQACIFPSGHVAAVTATALVVRAYRPRLGTLFIFAAASVAAATVFLRYHYAADALAGAVVGWAAFGVSQRLFGRRGDSVRS